MRQAAVWGRGAAWGSLFVLAVCCLASCAGGATGEPAASPSARGSSSAPADLTVVVTDGAKVTTWRLTCNPPGGDHPDPAAACQALEAAGERSLPAVAKDRVCTQIYGGAQTAVITGSWRGQPVQSRLSLVNGCEISRWKSLQGLLPPAGS